MYSTNVMHQNETIYFFISVKFLTLDSMGFIPVVLTADILSWCQSNNYNKQYMQAVIYKYHNYYS